MPDQGRRVGGGGGGRRPAGVLRTQYRMHPALSEPASLVLYGGALADGGAVATRAAEAERCAGLWPAGPGCPRAMCHVAGREVRAPRAA